jgi:sugar phosphate isomerase/epimerase
MTRRHLLAGAASAALAAVPQRTTMGVATTSYMTVRRPKDALEFLEHCHTIGAGGIQAGLTSLEPDYINKLRSRAEQLGMYIEVMGPLPRGDAAQFEAVVKGTKQAGALCLRTACLGGRRYETFKTLADWRKFVADSHAAIERALPVLEQHKLRMALENHKDWTLEEFAALLKHYSSPWLGVCLDTGNNIAMLDDPYELTEVLAPYAISTHIKDMAVAPYAEGFLLSEVPLGEGMLDLRRIVDTIRRAQPATKMSLEMITRNPLEVPCLADRYWVSFPGREGRHLARTLRMVSGKKSASLPRLDGMDRDSQLRVEEENVRKCLAYARDKLGLS